MAIGIEKFVPSPLRDSIDWGTSKRVNLRAIKNNQTHYKQAFVSVKQVYCFFGPVINNQRATVYSDEPLFVLGESISRVISSSTFVWIEKLEVVINQIRTYQYALVCSNNRTILIDQLSSDLDSLCYDYLRLLPQISDRTILSFKLNSEELEKLADALQIDIADINVLKSSALDQLDEQDETLPRTRELTEALADIDIVDTINQLVFFGFFAAIIAVFIFSQADSFVLFVESNGETIQVVKPQRSELSNVGIKIPSDLIKSALLSTLPLVDKGFYVLNTINWPGGNQLELLVDVDSKLSDRARSSILGQGYEVVGSTGTGQWEGSATFSLAQPFFVEPVKIGDKQRRSFFHDDPSLQAILTELENLTVNEWIHKIAEYLDGEVRQTGQEKNVALSWGKEVNRYTYLLSFDNQDIKSLEDLAKVLEMRNVGVMDLNLELSLEKGSFRTELTIEIYDTTS